jgi:hypothetical protein
MNKATKIRISELLTRLVAIQIQIECIFEEEQEKLENTPENLQNSEVYYEKEEKRDVLESALDSLNCAILDLECLR